MRHPDTRCTRQTFAYHIEDSARFNSVNRTEAVVKQHQRPRKKQGPGQSQALPLASGKIDAQLSNPAIETLRHRCDFVGHAYHLQGIPKIGGGNMMPYFEILPNGPREEKSLLRD